MTGDYRDIDKLEEEVDYSKRKKKKSAKALVYDEQDMIHEFVDLYLMLRPIDPVDFYLKLQEFIGNPQKFDPHWYEENGLSFLFKSKEQRLTIAAALEKKIRERLRFSNG